MVHAEICPVCGGSGLITDKTCHGCDGDGWVEVGSDDPVVVPVPYPQYVWPGYIIWSTC